MESTKKLDALARGDDKIYLEEAAKEKQGIKKAKNGYDYSTVPMTDDEGKEIPVRYYFSTNPARLKDETRLEYSLRRKINKNVLKKKLSGKLFHRSLVEVAKGHKVPNTYVKPKDDQVFEVEEKTEETKENPDKQEAGIYEEIPGNK